MRDIAVELLLPVDGLIVEIGCSNGNFAERLYKRSRVTKYLGIDINKKKIEEAKKRINSFSFLNLDIHKNLDILKKCSAVVTFQTLEHIGTNGGLEDCEVLESITRGTKIILSVPNSPYKREHKRWFEIDGWKERYSPYIDFDFEMVIQNPRKSDKRSFLFRGVCK
jgi:trans-aconitate methyltransferase